MSVLLSIAPVLLLFAALAMGRYPGERVLAGALSRRSRPCRAPRRAGSKGPVPFLVVRGGRLVGASLAGRAPPAVAH